MKPRNKEVNIFNMSLLDILCGALGAFCFMMLVLFQYWKPEGPDASKAKVETAQLEQKIQDLMKQMKGMSNLPPEVAQRLQQMEQQFNALQAQVAQLKALVQQSQAQSEAYKRQAAQAEARVKEAQAEMAETRKQMSKLQMRNPVTVVMTTYTKDHDVDLYVKDSKMAEVDPGKRQGPNWAGDVLYNSRAGVNSDVWMMRDVPAGEYKVYYKYISKGGNPNKAIISAYFIQKTAVYLPMLTLTDDHVAPYVGSIIVDANYNATFRPAPEFETLYKEQLEKRKAIQQEDAPKANAGPAGPGPK